MDKPKERVFLALVDTVKLYFEVAILNVYIFHSISFSFSEPFSKSPSCYLPMAL